MDKYTVDLDQVLNDFEYSELTDSQQNLTNRANLSAVPTQINNVFPSTSQPVQHKVKNVNSKHSITNVFNSLNEYLNSDIGKSRENNSVLKENNPNDVKYVNTSKYCEKENFYVEQKYYNKSDNELLNLNIDSVGITNVSADLNLYKEKPSENFCNLEDINFVEVKKEVVPENIKNVDIEETVINKGLIETEGLCAITEKQDIKEANLCVNICENIPTLNENIGESNLQTLQNVSCALRSNISENNQNIEDNIAVLQKNIEENPREPNLQETVLQNNNLEETEVLNETTNNEVKEKDNELSENLIDSKTNEAENLDDTLISNTILNNESIETPDRTINIDKSILNDSVVTPSQNVMMPIGFNDNLDIDDSQLHKYLEEIEQEFEDTPQSDISYVEKDMELIQDEKYTKQHENLEQNQLTGSKQENYNAIPAETMKHDFQNSKENFGENQSKDNEKIKIVKENLQPEHFNEELTLTTEKIELCKENTAELNLKVIEGNKIMEDNNKLKEDNEDNNKPKEDNNNLKEDIVSSPIEVKIEESKDGDNVSLTISSDGPSGSSEDINSSERPKTLDISYDSSESKREINLIGNPGSTPYNNVYVSKEMSNKEHQHLSPSDTDSTCSASPTFSNASTNSVNSTETCSDSLEDLPEAKNEKLPEEQTPNSSDVISDANVSNSSNNVDVEHSENQAAGDSLNTENKIEGEASSLQENPEDNDPVYNTGGAGDANEAYNDEAAALEYSESAMGTTTAAWLGKQAPDWIPDSQAISCLHCDLKFTVIKRRHHCRACGLVLCSKCCNLKYKLEFLDTEARVCFKCFDYLNKDSVSSSGSDAISPSVGNSPSRLLHQPNPNNPMEYCSVVPPLQQVANVSQNPPTVMVPVGVLKRKGSSKGKSNKSVMFCDGIRPGSDLTNLDTDFNYNESKSTSSTSKKSSSSSSLTNVVKQNKNLPMEDPITKSYIPSDPASLPPTVTLFKTDISYTQCANSVNVVEMLKNEALTFAIHRNLYVHVKIINMSCCINKLSWCFSTEGLITVGQDEVVYLLECLPEEKTVPKDLFFHINSIYCDALKGTTITEMSISLHPTQNFLDSKNHAGFLYIRPTFQCLKNVIEPKELYLIGILIHRWEIPWAKILPLRLVLRLGAEYRYYPSPIISTRNRNSVYVEIGDTFIDLLADFRNFVYTLPNIMGLTIHMEDKNTTVTIPSNRYDQVMKSINDSSDHILAFAGNFSVKADTHLVCIQDTEGKSENSYSTHAINIENKPRKVTGASFIVFNGALKSSSGLTAKSNIVEDGLMIQIPADNMIQVRESLRNMKNYTIHCGCLNAASDETVNIVWGDPDLNFNINVISPIDKKPLSGIPSIRVHNGKDFVCNSGNRLIRWTEVFIIQNGDDNARTLQGPVDISKISESISKATCFALVKYLDLLASNNFYKVGIRTILHVDNVSYSAGSNGVKLPPIYMRSLDNELIPALHLITSNFGENVIILELIFRILNV